MNIPLFGCKLQVLMKCSLSITWVKNYLVWMYIYYLNFRKWSCFNSSFPSKKFLFFGCKFLFLSSFLTRIPLFSSFLDAENSSFPLFFSKSSPGTLDIQDERKSYCSLLKPYPYVTQGMPAHAFVPLDKMPHRVYYSTSFFPRSVAEWNSLPADLFTSVTSLESFKTSVRAVVV